MNEVDSALIFFQALMKDTSFSNPYYNAVRYENLGTLLSKKGYLKEGLAYQLKGMQISRELDELSAQSYYNIATTYLKLGEYLKDERLLDTALSLASHEKNWALQKQIWRAKADNWTLQRKPWQASAARDSAFTYYDKEVDSSVIGRARELEAKYSLLEKDLQIKSLALSNQESERTREQQRRAIFEILCGVVVLGVYLYWVWKQKQSKMKTSEESLRQQLLRGQIDSHFLYSTMNGLQILIRRGKSEETARFVKQLARLFRLSLENALEPFVLLNNELDALKIYLNLQQTLFSNGFDYRIDLEGIQENMLIPPMLLQPFAENAILHGFAEQKEKGQINILIKRDHRVLYCMIEDNGIGFQGAATNQNQKRSLSTVINQQRLEILSRQTKTTAKLTIVDKKAMGGEPGVRVELIVPYQVAKPPLNAANRMDDINA